MARREQLKRSCKKQISYEECCNEAIESRKQVKHNPAKLFQVEIVDRDPTKKMLKLHYINYSTNGDVWVDDKKNDICPIVKVTKCYVPSAVSFDDRKFRFYEGVIFKVQKSLYFRRTMDPQCNLFINGDVDVFQAILDLCDADGTKFKLASLSLLNCLLGIQWYLRIKNEQGDYAFIEDNTFKVWIYKPRNITSYKCYNNTIYMEHQLEQPPVLKVTFVRNRGTSYQYKMTHW